MKCERCGKQEAVVRVTRISSDGYATTINLGNCEECLAERKYSVGAAPSFAPTLKGMLKEVVEPITALSTEEAEASTTSDLQCPSCGLEFASYRATGMLGCPDCYDSFEDQLVPELERYHRTTRHLPDPDELRRREIVHLTDVLGRLREDIRQAVDAEDFGEAAWIQREAAVIEAIVASLAAKLEAAGKEGS